jgi:hAT family C-terminal dimerisation region
MSAELERVFSQAKLTVTTSRNRLSPHTLEILELLRHWWINNIISQERGGGGRQYRKDGTPDNGSEILSTIGAGDEVDIEGDSNVGLPK